MNDLLSCFDKARSNRNHKISLPEGKREEFLSVLRNMLAAPRTRPTAPCA